MPATTPYYRMIIEDIRRKIASGELRPGDKLPSTRDLAAQYGVAKSTVRAAITILLETGVLESRQAVAVYVANPPADH